MCDSKKQDISKEKEFEKKLFHSLKYFGYLFPENIDDVDKFEELYGDTQIDVPEHLELEESHNSNAESILDFDFSNRIAAFSSKKISNFEIPKDLNIESGIKKGQIKKNKPEK